MGVIVTIIIPCRNEEAHIRKSVAAIYESDYPKENFEVIIAEGRSTDLTHLEIEKLKYEYPFLKVLDNEKQITPSAFNIGLDKGLGRYLITVGARHFISRNYLTTCVSILDSNSEIACVGGRSECIENSPTGEIIARAMATPFGVGYTNFRSINESAFVDTVGTPMYRKSILKEIGGFDETLVRNQDDELSYRITKYGYKIFQSNAIKVDYVARDSFGLLFKQLFQYGYWKVYVNRKHRTITTSRQLIPPLFVIYVFLLLIISPFSFFGKQVCYLPLAIYLTLSLVTAYQKAPKKKELIKFVWCFIIMHFSYGLGYLQGLFHFMILNKDPIEANKTISR